MWFDYRFKKITPIPDISHIQTLCRLLECMIIPQNIPSNDPPKELYELYFVFACIWAFGSSLYHDGTVDHRAEFSKWFSSEFKNVTFPPNGTVFDFYVDNHQQVILNFSCLLTFELWISDDCLHFNCEFQLLVWKN